MQTPTVTHRSSRPIPVTIVPAAPGWFAVDPLYEGDGTPIRELVRYPVVAWKIETITARDGSTFESTGAVAIELMRDPESLQSPDGRYHIFQTADFATEAELIAYFNEREEERRKARAGAEAGAQ